MRYIRSGIFSILFFSWTSVVILTLWLVIPLSPARFRSVISIWPKGCFALLKIIGITFEVRGIENIPNKPVLFSVKHQSVWETIFFLWHNKDNAYVMKSELTRIPFWGWYMKKSSHILVDRTGGAGSMRDMIAKAKTIMTNGRSIAIFPEGTRMPPGTIGKFHPGVAAIYTQLEATVVPVAVNSGVFWPRREFLKNPGNIIIEFLSPMEPKMDRKIFMAELQNRIKTATQKLEKEAGYIALVED
ncbi:MAG: lysophospholipid acyltransferase family protein [Rhodospirillales bacterium]|jgi:1-acyl-sn-glycerol-3-phosphate acyltransferase